MSLVADGHPNQEDICGWVVGTNNARRCEELLRAVRTGEYPTLYRVCLKSIEAIIHHFWDPNIHYRIHNKPPPGPILSQLRPRSTLSVSISFNICSNIIITSKPRSSELSHSLQIRFYFF